MVVPYRRYTTNREDPAMADTATRRRDRQWLLTEAPELLTQPDVASVTGRDRKTIGQMMDEGLLPGVRIGTRRFVPRTALVQLLGLEEITSA